jgi:outer membrane immunogenic protein
MMKPWFSFLAAMIGMGVVFQAEKAEAAVAGQPCVVAGATQVSDDQRSMLACLYYGPHSLVWNALASVPQYGAVPSGEAAATPAPTMQAPARTIDTHSRWQGWYAGGNVGYAGATDSFDNVSTNVGGSASPEDLDIDGGTAGLVGGYNKVTSSGLFYGGEADINYLSDAQHLNYMDGVTGNPIEAKSVWTGYATLRGRLGFAFDPGLLFLTGGLALADVRDTYSYPTGYPIVTGSSQSGIEVGWTAGAGAEFALTDNISMSAEYLRLKMPSVSNEYGSDNGSPLKFHLEDSANILRIGFNWHFN